MSYLDAILTGKPAVWQDGTLVVPSASALNFTGDITVTQDLDPTVVDIEVTAVVGSVAVSASDVPVVNNLVTLDFTGAAVSVSDSGSGKAVVSIPGLSVSDGEGVAVSGITSLVFPGASLTAEGPDGELEVEISGTGGTGLAGLGPQASLPAASSLSPGSVYYPTDCDLQMVSGESDWYVKAPGSPWVLAPGDLTGWTYGSYLVAAAELTSRKPFTSLSSSTADLVPYLKAFWSPTALPTDWTITACFRHTSKRLGVHTDQYSSIGIAFADASGHQFLFGPQLSTDSRSNAHASGYSAYARNYFSNLYSQELVRSFGPDVYFVRVSKSGSVYTTKWSHDGVNWTTTTAGGTGVLQWGSSGQDLTPTVWGVGTQYVPAVVDWDILSLTLVAD